jgi:predicted transcriptional regulator
MKLLLFLCVPLLSAHLFGQEPADSAGVFSIAPNVLPLRNWSKFTYDDLHLNYPELKPDLRNFYRQPVIPDNPFLVDLRGNPFYTPRFVTDELNMIMNRPKDTAFIPVLGVAFLALQLAQQHLLISAKTEITPRDILQVPDGLVILRLLWEKSPRTAPELYKDSTLTEQCTMKTLEEILSRMADNKLVRQKMVENSPVDYFAALSRQNYIDLLDRGMVDSTLTLQQKTILEKLKTSRYLSDYVTNPGKK